jgi:catechol 2,3-dioxygenase-like lactoylglutathione lyase family enzyme
VSLHSFTHLALRVEKLREAEAFYCRLFGLSVAWREAETPHGWYTLPEPAGWDDAEGVGIDLKIVMLYRDGLRLALEAVESVVDDGQLSHVGVFCDEDDLTGLRRDAANAGCLVVADRERALIFDDPYGVRRELNTFAYEDPPSMSTGARSGSWLKLPYSSAPTSEQMHRL